MASDYGRTMQLREDLSRVETDLQHYKRLLVDAKAMERNPTPDGYKRLENVPIIEGVIRELQRLYDLYSNESANATRP